MTDQNHEQATEHPDEGSSGSGSVPFEQWYAAVVAEAKRRGFEEWFYRDRTAWREDYDNGETPVGAVQYNYECCF